MTGADLFQILVGSAGDPDRGRKSVLIQGMTGRYGSLHSQLMLEYGTNIVGGVVPGKGGTKVHDKPIFNTMAEAVEATGSRISAIFVPAPYFRSAAEEALQAGAKAIVAITEHVPVRDTLSVLRMARERDSIVVGPNTPGVIIPSIIKLGIMPAEPFRPGGVALFSRSGTLMYEVAHHLSSAGLGQAVALGVGGDPVNCTSLIECLEWVRNRADVSSVVIVGEIGGDAEERICQHIRETSFSKPAVAYVAGKHAPREKKMGHAGAIIYGSYGTADSKISSFEAAGIPVAPRPSHIPILLRKRMA